MKAKHNLSELVAIATRLRMHVVNKVAPFGQGYVQTIVTAENHSIIGGLGSAVAEVLMDAGTGLPFKRAGIQDRFCEGGTTPYLMNKFGLNAPAIAQAVRAMMEKKT